MAWWFNSRFIRRGLGLQWIESHWGPIYIRLKFLNKKEIINPLYIRSKGVCYGGMVYDQKKRLPTMGVHIKKMNCTHWKQERNCMNKIWHCIWPFVYICAKHFHTSHTIGECLTLNPFKIHCKQLFFSWSKIFTFITIEVKCDDASNDYIFTPQNEMEETSIWDRR